MLPRNFIPPGESSKPALDIKATPKQPQGQEIPSLVGKRAVVVEDEGVTQIQLVKIVTMLGMKVVGRATTGESGIEVVLRERPDLVLMDIKMPGSIDGLEAARHILTEYHTCVVILTAYDLDEYKEQAEQIGASGYVTKPVTSDSFTPLLRSAMEKFYRA